MPNQQILLWFTVAAQLNKTAMIFSGDDFYTYTRMKYVLYANYPYILIDMSENDLNPMDSSVLMSA